MLVKNSMVQFTSKVTGDALGVVEGCDNRSAQNSAKCILRLDSIILSGRLLQQ